MKNLMLVLCLLVFCTHCAAEEIRQTKQIKDLEVTLRLESGTMLLGRPFPVEVMVTNVGSGDVVIGDMLVFLKNFNVKVFDLTYNEPVPLTRAGRWAQDNFRGRNREIALAPGESVLLGRSLLGRDFDLSVLAKYRVELTWYPGTVTKEPPKDKPEGITLTAEFNVMPDLVADPPAPRKQVAPAKQQP